MPMLVDAEVLDPSGPTLFLSRCQACGSSHFPPRQRCPDCFHGDVERVPASGRATLRSATDVRLSDPGLVRPCIVGEVQLQEGPRLHALLDGFPGLEATRFGAPLQLTIGVVRRDGEIETIGYRFRGA